MKLQRADKLIGGLGGERVRWQATVQQLSADLHNAVGDVVVAAGSIAYSGPFTPGYRCGCGCSCLWICSAGSVYTVAGLAMRGTTVHDCVLTQAAAAG